MKKSCLYDSEQKFKPFLCKSKTKAYRPNSKTMGRVTANKIFIKDGLVFIFYRLPLCIWSDVFPVRWQNQNSQESREWCENWIIRERTQMSPIVPRTPNCPCGMSKAENDPGHFHADPYCDKRKTSSKLNCVYNKDAQQCYRRNIQR